MLQTLKNYHSKEQGLCHNILHTILTFFGVCQHDAVITNLYHDDLFHAVCSATIEFGLLDTT